MSISESMDTNYLKFNVIHKLIFWRGMHLDPLRRPYANRTGTSMPVSCMVHLFVLPTPDGSTGIVTEGLRKCQWMERIGQLSLT